MNVEDVKVRVAQICDAAAAGDHEKAHIFEDQLHSDVLVAIASGAHNPDDLAYEAIKTKGIYFARNCA